MAIDHSVVTAEAWWPTIEAVVKAANTRLILSVWNLVEIGLADDKAQQARRLEFLQGLEPWWVIERLQIQKQEVERFLWKHYFQAVPKELLIITPHLSVVDYFFAGELTRVGLTARQFIDETDFSMLRAEKRHTPAALKTLQAADKSLLRAKEKEMFEAWIAPNIPDVGSDGRTLNIDQKFELLQFCYAKRKQFLSECPAIAAEDALFAVRTRDPRRNPTESDGADLQHAVVGLAYCDIFATGDGYQARCATDASKAMGPGFATVCSGREQLARAVARP
jgi:hypothetical protein